MIDFLTIGIVLGLSTGFSPGPLLTLVIAESLRHGVMAGVKIALAPVITDLPIILLALLIADRLAGFKTGLGLISLAGGIFILVTALGCLRIQPVDLSLPPEPPRSLLKGVVTNLLNPHPYLFWISVGAPLMSKAVSVGIAALFGFLGGFYLCLVGSKIILAIAVGRSGTILRGRVYLYTLRFLGVLLVVFALFLFRDGMTLLGVW